MIAIFTCMTFFKMAVTVDPGHGFRPFARPPRCKLQSYTQPDNTMLDSSQSNLIYSLKHTFEFTNIHRSFSTPCLSISSRVEDESDINARIEIIGGRATSRVRNMVVEVAIAMASGINPEPVSSGLGGAYFLRTRNGDPIAVAKPIDEEPLAFNNPKGFCGRMFGQPGIKRSIKIGETGLRESAAYLLDHGGFAGVPPTVLVKFSHVKFNVNSSEVVLAPLYKIASLQSFVNHYSDAADLGPSGFSVSSIHHIGILDVRLMNLDRHAGNILVKQGKEGYVAGKAELVPIDHGFCLPESLDDPYFEWLHWPQASIPFSESEVEYISSLDPFKDAELLRVELPAIRESSVRILVLCTIFLKQATAYGFCLAEIGEMMTREFHGEEENWSAFENICINSRAGLNFGKSNDIVSNDHDEDEVCEISQFNENEYGPNQVIDFAQNSQNFLAISGKPLKIPRYSSLSILDDSTLFHLNENDILQDLNTESDDDANEDYNSKAGVLMRSMSFPAPKYSHDAEGISFGEMNDQEWELFLDSFEKLLPEAFEGRKSILLPKLRVGSSCEF
ncbi:phosphatidylinositol 4-kinase gamma 8-like [Olea europaea var. sylvestris]|uniref:phosphatidylinositol 4-kinase gamma 8-like n=1 Tax=Olea europaea var. sylvestris TaxID=158386 RepID=UPI000C1D0857|nr:phosphatidylinositol 4-kinase gamma 8-like [Olea europaea var. sylvestris]XP_022872097.1 phosphatidylinositol 4-kinase gamma 8-like [Olea europaea var. sylvestris]